MSEYTDKISGKLKQVFGALTGDEQRRKEGVKDERKGEVKEKVNDAADTLKNTIDDARDKAGRA